MNAMPRKGNDASFAYRLRNPFLDGTNNADEHASGWWVKECYQH